MIALFIIRLSTINNFRVGLKILKAIKLKKLSIIISNGMNFKINL